jgi:hypothetical protein
MTAADVWSFLLAVGRVVVAIGVAVLAIYYIPPLRQLVDTWIGRRVSHHFDKQLADHEHELTLIADAVRARHQRLLQNSAIVAERKHEVYRRLFHLLHAAMGKVTHLFGYVAGGAPDYDAFDDADVEHALTAARVPGKTKEAIRQQWENDPKWARRTLDQFARSAAIGEAAATFGKAWNYYLGNALYLPVPIEEKVHQAFIPLEKTLILARTPGSHGDYTAWAKEASDRVEELKVLLRAELRVVDEGGDDAKATKER